MFLHTVRTNKITAGLTRLRSSYAVTAVKVVVRTISTRKVIPNAPINGMPHLAYLGQMLEKEGEFGIGIFPEGLVHSRDCQNEL